MMPIRYRARRVFDGNISNLNSWVYDSNLRINYEHKRINLKGVECEFDTLGKFTGLQDRFGTDIYEGDVVTAYFNFGPAGGEEREAVIEVGPFGINLQSWVFDKGNEWALPAIVGNIHGGSGFRRLSI